MKAINQIDFPLISSYKTNGKRLVYLDSASTTQKPNDVLDAERNFYLNLNANPLRGIYDLSVESTKAYENARHKVAEFINAKEIEIIFTRNATESINLIMYSYALEVLQPGDEILISILEHHSNLLPWQAAAKKTGATLKYLYCNRDGKILSEEIDSKLSEKTKIVSIAHVSNVLGIMNPVEEIIEKAHKLGAVVILDCAQSIPHNKIDVKKLDADFLVFSGHKLYGPMGIGVLYGKYQLLKSMPPFLTGGEMIDSVHEQSANFAKLPHYFEAGTPNVPGAIGLATAIDYINQIGYEEIIRHEQELITRLLEGLQVIPFVTVYGSSNPKDHHGVISFNMKEVHPHDVATILNEEGIAIRAGKHCAEPLLEYMGVRATCRVSVGMYNTMEDIDCFLNCMKQVRSWLGYGS